MNLYFSRKKLILQLIPYVRLMFCRASPVSEPVFLGQGKPRNVGSHSWLGYMIR